ncbi:CAP domain-containing protein [Secundilactobacillus hailunensis]|uniref:CAP domain-containing protein n=1 Tax=Secundilactobacillus hailunensis TaxID=2559923 RepID=A0ABW1TAS7_9LACO|nr:CAP domain-containing protein [Secundilactobacillus hailunensis]
MAKNFGRKTGPALFAALTFALTAGLVPATQATAKTKIHYQKMTAVTFTVLKKNATVYSSAFLTHKKGNMKSFGNKVTGYNTARVTKNGKTALYYQFKVGKKGGWIWHGYLKKGSQSIKKPVTQPVTKQGQSVKFNEGKVDARFLELINQQRVKAGSKPVKVDQNLFNKVTTIRAHQIVSRFSHYDSHRKFIAEGLAKKKGLSPHISENIAYYPYDGEGTKVADDTFNGYFYHDADSNWGHRDNILDPSMNRVAIASVYHDGYVYNVMNFTSTDGK